VFRDKTSASPFFPSFPFFIPSASSSATSATKFRADDARTHFRFSRCAFCPDSPLSFYRTRPTPVGGRVRPLVVPPALLPLPPLIPPSPSPIEFWRKSPCRALSHSLFFFTALFVFVLLYCAAGAHRCCGRLHSYCLHGNRLPVWSRAMARITSRVPLLCSFSFSWRFRASCASLASGSFRATAATFGPVSAYPAPSRGCTRTSSSVSRARPSVPRPFRLPFRWATWPMTNARTLAESFWRAGFLIHSSLFLFILPFSRGFFFFAGRH